MPDPESAPQKLTKALADQLGVDDAKKIGINYFKSFFKSPHHATLAAATIGVGLLSVNPLILLGGVAAYAVGWIYLPESSLFRRWTNLRRALALQEGKPGEVEAFLRSRQKLLESLDPQRQRSYQQLAGVCRDIERALNESHATQGLEVPEIYGQKLDQMMWTYLRLLVIEQSIHHFLHLEKRDELPEMLEEARQEAASLEHEMAGLAADHPNWSARQRTLDSKKDRLHSLEQRAQKISEAEANLQLAIAEQERMVEQIKLLRADAIASQHGGALSERIDANVLQIGQTNEWLGGLGSFAENAGQMPQVGVRLGYITGETSFPGSETSYGSGSRETQ